MLELNKKMKVLTSLSSTLWQWVWTIPTGNRIFQQDFFSHPDVSVSYILGCFHGSPFLSSFGFRAIKMSMFAKQTWTQLVIKCNQGLNPTYHFFLWFWHVRHFFKHIAVHVLLDVIGYHRVFQNINGIFGRHEEDFALFLRIWEDTLSVAGKELRVRPIFFCKLHY